MVKNTLHKLLKDKTGATVVEYGLLLTVFATFVLFGVRALASGSGSLWSQVSNKSAAAMSQH